MIASNLKKITIGEKGVILKFNDKEVKEMSFLEINKICMKVKKVPLKYNVLFGSSSLGIVLFLVGIYRFNLVAILLSFLILVGSMK